MDCFSSAETSSTLACKTKKEDVNIMLSTKLRPGCTLFAVGLTLASAPLRVQADIVLSFVDPASSGVFAANSTTDAFAPATDNPARAVVNGSHASMRNFGSQLIFSANIDGFGSDNFIASTGAGPAPSTNYGAIGLQVVGTAGEADGTPVSLTLNSGYNGPGNVIITQIAHGANYAVNATSAINGLKVGDTFDLWSMLNGNGAFSATLTTTLTVALTPSAHVPEPGFPTLLATCVLALSGMGLRHKHRR